jgi:predicted MPP superfamily phosphohydrolase
MQAVRRSDPEPGRRRFLRTITATTVGFLTGGFAHGVLYERHRLALTSHELALAMLPEGLEGLRVALLTDLHLSETVSSDSLEHAVDLVQRAAPDLVLLGGDYVTSMNRRFVEPCAAILGRLRAPHGVHAVLGNHDDEEDSVRALQRQRIPVLRDARTTIPIRGASLDLIGLRYWTRRTADITRLLRGASGWPLLLAHDPRRFGQAAALNIPLVLSGHTHGGQIVLPGIGAVAARKFPVVSGTATQENTTIYVSPGVGTVYVPCRINCPPEVAILTLRRAGARREPSAAGSGG